MVQMSRYKVKDRVNEKIEDLLFEVLGVTRGRKDFNLILLSLLSPIERLMVGKRIAIMYLLELGIDYEIIRSILCVSTSTIAKCVIMLDTGKKIKEVISIQIRHKKLSDGILALISQIYTPGIYGFNWSNARRFHRELERRKVEGI